MLLWGFYGVVKGCNYIVMACYDIGVGYIGYYDQLFTIMCRLWVAKVFFFGVAKGCCIANSS